MHPILLKVQTYLSSVANGTATPIDKELLFAFHKSNDGTIAKNLSKRSDTFRIRLSNIGRPLCQLQMEKSNAVAEEDQYSSPIRNAFGDLSEALVVLVLKAAGVKVVSEQLQVTLRVAGEAINGTLDVIIEEDGIERVWDIKSASGWAFKHKFDCFASVVKDDPWGYSSQLFAYAKASGKLPGGWIVISKETGEINVISVPDYYDQHQKEALTKAEDNVTALVTNAPFQRSFSDIEEVFKRKSTGNRILGITCTYCAFKHSCYENLIYQNSIPSTADTPKKVWYTHISEG